MVTGITPSIATSKLQLEIDSQIKFICFLGVDESYVQIFEHLKKHLTFGKFDLRSLHLYLQWCSELDKMFHLPDPFPVDFHSELLIALRTS